MRGEGFTLIELLVVTGIIVLLSAMFLPIYKTGQKSFALQRAAHKVAQDLRRAQELSASSHEFQGQVVPQGYGIRFEQGSSSYILFADLNKPQGYNNVAEKVEEIELEAGIVISGLSASPYLTVIFIPPDPETVIMPAAASAVIELNEGKKRLEINKAGLIDRMKP